VTLYGIEKDVILRVFLEAPFLIFRCLKASRLMVTDIQSVSHVEYLSQRKAHLFSAVIPCREKREENERERKRYWRREVGGVQGGTGWKRMFSRLQQAARNKCGPTLD